jgi:hypothetical protein
MLQIYMKYKCIPCKYETHDLSNFTKHKTRQKHIKKVNSVNNDAVGSDTDDSDISDVESIKSDNNVDKKLLCNHCNTIFASSYSLKRHSEKCIVKIINNKDAIIKQLKDDNAKIIRENDKRMKELLVEHDKRVKAVLVEKTNRIKELLAEKERVINEKNYLFEYLKTVTTKHGEISIVNSTTNLSSIDAMTFLITYRKNAHLLNQIDYKDAVKILNYDENRSIKYVKSLICEFKRNNFVKMISSLIVDQYKTDDPNEQSFWSINDADYLIYGVSQHNTEPTWIADKNGVQITNYILKPILDVIYQLLYKYIHKITKPNKLFSNDNTIDYDQIDRHIKSAQIASNIMNYIKCGTLTNDILSEMAPKFTIDKSLLSK